MALPQYHLAWDRAPFATMRNCTYAAHARANFELGIIA
jgi:hypothetical protein